MGQVLTLSSKTKLLKEMRVKVSAKFVTLVKQNMAVSPRTGKTIELTKTFAVCGTIMSF